MTTIQSSLTGFRDLMYTTDPNALKAIQGFSFNRDEFIFMLIDNKTKIITKSQTKISIRVGKEELIELVDDAGVWSLKKYNDTILDGGDPEIVWLKNILDTLIINITLIIGNDPTGTEYTNLLSRITSNQV